MSEPPWKKLVLDLKDSGLQSPYLERLRARLPSATCGHHDLAREVLQEMASALGRAEDKVNAALLRLELSGRAIDELASARQRGERWRREADRRVAEFNREREVAERLLWELRVHREAVGFRHEADLGAYYPIPPRRDRIP